jgi:hypothetical protein
MAFKKIATVEPLGSSDVEKASKGSWSKTASKRIISSYIDDNLVVDFEGVLNEVADFYKISRDPYDYLLIPARAVSADRPNENLDGWDYEELVRFDPRLGKRVYRTFEAKPHFVNHRSDNPLVARGVILDASLNEKNAATDEVKKAVFSATGKEVNYDVFTECLIAMDTTKDPELARAYKEGAVDKFSMGCDVEYTTCSYCGNEARSVGDFCKHIKNKMSRRAIYMPNGVQHIPYEKCGETIFQELSVVDLPADRSAKIQEGILDVSKTFSMPYHLASKNFSKLSSKDLSEISSFVIKHSNEIPDSLAKILIGILENN